MKNTKKIYMVGIKGAGMASLAIIYKKMGNKVLGSDVQEIFSTDEILRKNGIEILRGFAAKNISDDIDFVVTTGAHDGLSNIEVMEAKAKSIPVFTHAQALGLLMEEFKIKISVCGTHGKTTTTALAAFVFKELGLKIGYLVGAAKFSGFWGGGYQGNDFFIAEADEYLASPGIDNTPRFLYQNPDYILATNVDFDHPDAFKNLDEVKSAFSSFFEKLKKKRNSFLIYNADDKALDDLVKKKQYNAYSYGFSEKAQLRAGKIEIKKGRMYFNAFFRDRNLGKFSLSVAGEHNVKNACAVILLSILLDIDLEMIRKLLPQFRGVSRRFELIFKHKDTLLYDDYAHHPVELKETLKASAMLFPNKRIILIFQPHTYSRTVVLLNDFIDSLALADKTLVVDIFSSAREKNESYDISSENLSSIARHKGYNNISYVPRESLVKVLSSTIKSGDLILTAGAGDIYTLHNDIIRVIKGL